MITELKTSAGPSKGGLHPIVVILGLGIGGYLFYRYFNRPKVKKDTTKE